MKHWTEFDPDASIKTAITVGINPKLWHYIEQTRGDKSRSQFIRDMLIKVMENTEEAKSK